MTDRRQNILQLVAFVAFLGATPLTKAADTGKGERHFLYVAAPGIRNLLEFGGAGVLVFDIDHNHAFVRRIPTPASRVEKPENVKGVCACAATKRLYFSTLTRLYCVDLVSDKTLWEKALPDGCDRMSMTPDGKVLYVPTLEKIYCCSSKSRMCRPGKLPPDSGHVPAAMQLESQAHSRASAWTSRARRAYW